ncbi:RNA polymerase sigma factor [Pedobacter nutrimenti]|jgi:RNA polymerase sigma-70 factor (ECF subfamily)|uniref:Sigma-70-like protein n=1 Tax=Pedobacter nutrimenti TaxID=1241337 RepID=A0A318UFM3_9SPHI|nr:sigma factor [Pedobacter nutrimenti]PYF75176.1 sigma-70-like protein [Pedobacter nutrimenti]
MYAQSPEALYAEKELLVLLKQDKAKACALLYNKYKPRLASNLMALLKSDQLVKEVLEQFFFGIWDNRKHIDPEKSFRMYLSVVSRNLIQDYYGKAVADEQFKAQLIRAGLEKYNRIEERAFLKTRSQNLYPELVSAPVMGVLVNSMLKGL